MNDAGNHEGVPGAVDLRAARARHQDGDDVDLAVDQEGKGRDPEVHSLLQEVVALHLEVRH